MNNLSLDDYVYEALKMPSNTTWCTGTIAELDRVGTTLFVQAENGRRLLAFVDRKNPLQPGDAVRFRISGLRAVDIQKIPAAAISQHG